MTSLLLSLALTCWPAPTAITVTYDPIPLATDPIAFWVAMPEGATIASMALAEGALVLTVTEPTPPTPIEARLYVAADGQLYHVDTDRGSK